MGLTNKDFRFNFIAFWVFSKLWCFPIEFYRPTATIQISANPWRKIGFFVFLALCTAQASLMSLTTFVAGVICRNLGLEYLTLGVTSSVSYSSICYIAYAIYDDMSIHEQLWTLPLPHAGQVDEPTSSLFSKRWQEMLIIIFPFLVYLIAFVWPAVYLIHPELPFTTYGMIRTIGFGPSNWLLIVCCLVDTYATTFYLFISNYMVVYVTYFLLQTQDKLRIPKDSLLDRLPAAPKIGTSPDRRGESTEKASSSTANPPEDKGDKVKTNSEAGPSIAGSSSPSVKVEKEYIKGKGRGRGKNSTKWILQGAVGGNSPVKTKFNSDIELLDMHGGEVKVNWDRGVGMHGEGAPGHPSSTTNLDADLTAGPQQEVNLVAVNPTTRAKGKLEDGQNVPVKRKGKAKDKTPRKPNSETNNNRGPGENSQNWALRTERAEMIATAKKARWHVDNEVPGPSRLAKTGQPGVNILSPANVNLNYQPIAERELRMEVENLELQNLRVRLFNKAFRWPVFLSKIVCIACTTLSLFAAIRVIEEHPVFGCIYILTAMNSTAAYTAMYNNAFWLTRMSTLYKKWILLKTTLLLGDPEEPARERTHYRRNEIRLRLRAIPPLAVQSGMFNKMERNSTLIYAKYSQEKLGDLLVAF